MAAIQEFEREKIDNRSDETASSYVTYFYIIPDHMRFAHNVMKFTYNKFIKHKNPFNQKKRLKKKSLSQHPNITQEETMMMRMMKGENLQGVLCVHVCLNAYIEWC